MSHAASNTEGIIRVMPDQLANKIAAGEVVQRPASVLKELVENALDAGADAIDVIIKSAGSELVQVIDNGSGMHPADARSCFRRHATSKIRSVDDLERLHTLGFRGEALASIAAVAQVELKTKRMEDDAGLYVRVEGGKMVTAEPCATPNGTSMAVRNLFYNVPARRNFLKTPATEFKHLVETFQFLALANPRVRFSLHHDDRLVYRLQAASEGDRHEALQRRIGELFDEKHARHLIAVDDGSSYLSVRGFIGEPELHRRSRNEQFLFVNDRYVKHHYLEHAVRSAYEGLIAEGNYPFFALFLTLDPRHVDVNVHPTKAEVKFDDESGIYRFLKNVAKRALGMSDVASMLDGKASFEPVTRSSTSDSPSPISFRSDNFRAGGSRFSSDDSPPFSFRETDRRRSSHTELPGALSQQLYDLDQPGEEEDGAQPSRPVVEDDSKVWHIQQRYVVTPVRGGLLVVDQTRAHERVLYEDALRHMEAGAGPSQQLLFPHTVDFNPSDYELLERLLPHLRAVGFDIEKYSGRSVVVRGIPADIRSSDETAMLEEVLDQYKIFASSMQVKARQTLARSLARQNAIQPGKRLSTDEMVSLLKQFTTCEMPHACPAGRRTYIKISLDELNYRFGS